MGVYTDWLKEIQQTIDKLNGELTNLETEKSTLDERLWFLGENHDLKSLFQTDIENGQKRSTELVTLIEDKKTERNKYGLLKSLVEVRSAKEESN